MSPATQCHRVLQNQQGKTGKLQPPFDGPFLANRLRGMPYGRGVLRTEALLADADVFREKVLMSSRYFPTRGRIEQEMLFGRCAAFDRGHPLNDIGETKGGDDHHDVLLR